MAEIVGLVLPLFELVLPGSITARLIRRLAAAPGALFAMGVTLALSPLSACPLSCPSSSPASSLSIR